jgi:hypothetical protein
MQKPSCDEYRDELTYLAQNTLSGTMANWKMTQDALLEQGYYFNSETPCHLVHPVAQWLVDTLKNRGLW